MLSKKGLIVAPVLIILWFFLVVILTMAISSKLAQGADVITLTNTSNELINDNMVVNHLGGGTTSNEGWLVVGDGEFNVGLFAVTFEKDSPDGFWLDIDHGAICRNTADGGLGIDHPDNRNNPRTTFYAFNPSFNTIFDNTSITAGRDCGNPDRSMWIPPERIWQIRDTSTGELTGKYGGIILAVLSSDGCGSGCSQQNSFRFFVDPSYGVKVGYESNVATRAQQSFLGLPSGEINFVTTFLAGGDPSWFSEVTSPYSFKVNLSHTNINSDLYHTDYFLDFDTQCSLVTVDDARVQFVDMDDASSGGRLQSTGVYKTAKFVLERREGNGPWEPVPSVNERFGGGLVNEVELRSGDGKDEREVVRLGPIEPGYAYRGKVINVSRRNALQLSINNSLSLAADTAECPAATCSIVGNKLIKPNETFEVNVNVGIESGADFNNPSTTDPLAEGLHFGLAEEGNPATWDARSNPINPPPDRQSTFEAQGGGNISGVTHYTVNDSGFTYRRYYMNDFSPTEPPPGGTRSVTMRVKANFSSGSRTLVIRMLDRQQSAWLPKLCSVTVTIDPALTTTCGLPGTVSGSPGQNVQIPITFNRNGTTWPAGNGGQGLHIGVAVEGNPSTWNQSGNNIDPPPDTQSQVIPVNAGLSNATYYTEDFQGFNYKRFYVNNPQTDNATISVRAPSGQGSTVVVIRMLKRNGGAWLQNYCTTTLFANNAPSGSISASCSVVGTNRSTGTVSSSYTVVDADGDNLTISLTSPVSQTKTNNNGSTGNRTGNFDDFTLARRTADYTLTGTVSDGIVTVDLTSTDVNCPAPPIATCNVTTSAFTIDPLRTFTINVDIDGVSEPGRSAWPASNANQGLHVGVTHQNNTNWNSNGAGVNPPPDAGSLFSAIDQSASAPGENLSNVSFYDPGVANVTGRYWVNDPYLSGDSTLRIQAPATTGDFRLIVRLYDREAQAWLSQRCGVDVEMKLLPLTCTIGFSDPVVQVNKPFIAWVTASNPNLVPVPLESAAYSTSPDVVSGNGATIGPDPNPPAFSPPVDVPASVGGAFGTLRVNSVEEVISQAGDYTFVWSIEYLRKNGDANTLQECPDSASNNLSVREVPYVKFYGNDIYAGGGFGQQCIASSTTASAVSAMNVEPTGGYFQGASAELAIFAVNTIQGIRPGAGRSPADLTELAFANTGSGVPNDPGAFIFGGGFNQTICSEDYWTNRKGTEISPDFVVPGEIYPSLNLSDYNGQRERLIITADQLPADRLTVYATSDIPDGTRITLYVDGDVVLGRNGTNDTEIVNENTSWTANTDIPSVYIIARGNIYIDDTITELNGVFIAQPVDNGGTLERGEIHTCSHYAASDVDLVEQFLINEPAASDVLAGRCNQKLVVNGALVATNIELLRTLGNVSSAPDNEPYTSNNIAEVFRFNPLLFLAGGDGVPPPADESVLQYESILSLPPSF